ncbi:hypothetical protein ECG_08473 [Echinococcus granulosus]|nr:hypothetical protein ECG_08473 [Echinococcus granulosus]
MDAEDGGTSDYEHLSTPNTYARKQDADTCHVPWAMNSTFRHNNTSPTQAREFNAKHAKGNSVFVRNITKRSKMHSPLRLDSQADKLCTEEANQSTSPASQTNVLTVSDFDPFSTLSRAQNLMRTILQPSDEFTNEVFGHLLLMMTFDRLNFVKDTLENPVLFMRLSHAHRNLCLGWFAFFCDHLPHMVEKHPKARKVIVLSKENHDYLIEFCQKFQRCLPIILDMDPHHVMVYDTWCPFYHPL